MTTSRTRLTASLLAAGVTLGSAGLLALDISPAAATPSGYALTFYAGTGSYGGATPGPATASMLTYPTGLSVDSAGSVYFAQGSPAGIFKVDTSNVLSAVAGDGTNGLAQNGPALSSPLRPYGTALDAAGNVYIADTSNELIEKVTPGGQLTIIAGNGNGVLPSGNIVIPGPALSTNIGTITSVVVDPAGNIYAAYPNGHVVEKIDTAGQVSIFAGNATSAATTPGVATAVSLATPQGLALGPDGSVYIVDDGNQVVSRVDPAGALTVVAGNGSAGAAADGATATATSLQYPVAIAVDPAGDLYIADAGNNRIEKVSDGVLHFLAGNGTTDPSATGDALSVSLNNPEAIAVDPRTGTLYVNDEGGYHLDTIAPAAVVPAAATGLSAAAGNTSVALAFTTPRWVPGGAITGYEYSLDNGASWHTLAATVTGDAVSATVTGLTNGQRYSFEVRARSATGGGPASAAATATPSDPTPPPQQAASMTVDLAVKIDTRLAGSQAVLTGGGLRPGSPFTLEMHSQAVLLTRGQADSHGVFRSAITMPGRACVHGGLHQLVLTGIAANGTAITTTKWILLDDTCINHGQFASRPTGAIKLKTLPFRYKSAVLTPAAKATLRAVASSLRGARTIVVTGYTQTELKGSAARRANLVLAQRRTAAVKAYLRRLGIRVHIVTTARGGVNPVSTKRQALNRRVELAAGY